MFFSMRYVHSVLKSSRESRLHFVFGIIDVLLFYFKIKYRLDFDNEKKRS